VTDAIVPELVVTRTTHDHTQVIHVVGVLDLSQAPLLGRRIDEALHAGPHLVIVDVSGVGLCDSSGLSELINAHHRATAADAGLVLAGVSASMRRQLTITGLDAIFDSYPTLDAALRHTRPSA
jgi:anti-sigma B factor antagonist